jgi:dodecin
MYYVMTHVAKVIELVGSSDKGWTEAAQAALEEAKKTVRDITGLEVNGMTASVDPNTSILFASERFNTQNVVGR